VLSHESDVANPYHAPRSPPAASATPSASVSRARHLGGWSLALLAIALTLGALAVPMAGGARLAKVAMVLFGGGAVAALVGFVRALQSLATGGAVQAREAPLFTLAVGVALLSNGVVALFGGIMALWAMTGFARGRQLRRRGLVLQADIQDGPAWATDGGTVSLPENVRAAVATRWRENGRNEHASVAAFAQLTLELVALGAPPDLIAASQEDGLDETRHAELCFALARAIDARAAGPAPFPAARRSPTRAPTRSLALAALAVDSLVDGALNEGVSARVIARLAKCAADPRVRDVLKELAADEGRHAAHGWDVVRWCVSEGGSIVQDALRGAVAALPHAWREHSGAAGDDGAWGKYGLPGHELEATEYASARANLAARVEELLARRAA